MKPLFCIGLHKTGTSTISRTLKKSGIKGMHLTRWTIHSRLHDKEWFKEELSRFKHFSDGLGVDFKWLNENFDSFFILNTRPLRSWLISKWNHHKRTKRNGMWHPDALIKKHTNVTSIKDITERDIKNWIYFRNEYHKVILDYFKDKENFILLDLSKDSSAHICKSLESITSKSIQLYNSNILSHRKGYNPSPKIINKVLKEMGITEEFYDNNTVLEFLPPFPNWYKMVSQANLKNIIKR